ncbi:hypothetical protein B0H15DRAFT_950759 [Mycena belliarum]|uniref:Uncharacterized protein n=1 Tax=Mycena belliarum TaxID=1033014 RepID=A0AAD6XQZ3_9AGAR|nr:hypothetical protein B0H15DRAFT_950759 [Mycena belliae]
MMRCARAQRARHAQRRSRIRLRVAPGGAVSRRALQTWPSAAATQRIRTAPRGRQAPAHAAVIHCAGAGRVPCRAEPESDLGCSCVGLQARGSDSRTQGFAPQVVAALRLPRCKSDFDPGVRLAGAGLDFTSPGLLSASDLRATKP